MSGIIILDNNKALRQILKAVIVIVVLTIFTIHLILLIINENNDWPNLITLVVEISIGGTISVIVYVYSKRQHDDNQKQSSDIKNILDNIQPLVKDLERGRIEERKLASRALFLSLKGLIRRIDDILRLDDKYEQKTTDEQKIQILMRQQKIIEQMRSILNIGINYLDMARIFSAETATKYSDVQTDIVMAQISLTPEDHNSEHVYNRKYWEECIKQCETLKEMVKLDNRIE